MTAAPQKRKPKIPKKITPDYLRNSGLYYLQRFAASTHQFRKVMRMKISRSIRHHGTPELEQAHSWLEDLIQEFEEIGYLNDEAYLTASVRSLRLSRGLSQRMILMKLGQKGFSENEVIGALNDLMEDGEAPSQSELHAALRFAERKKLGPYHPDPPRKTPEQQLASLARAGFSYDICRKVFESGEQDLMDRL